jgi:hypothetical protein
MRHLVRSALLSLITAAGCATAPTLEPVPEGTPMGVGESRQVELRFLRFDVQNFEQTLTRKDVNALPAHVKDRLWLLDLDLSNGPTSPHLLDNALAAIRALDPATLTPPARNLQRLLNMTPDTANLQGTSLSQLIDLAPLLGIAPSQVLADIMGVNVEDTFLPSAVISDAMLEGVITSHPNARVRPGPVNAEHPDGLYPVAKGSIPITLADAASDFATLPERFGPVSKDGVMHPGFLTGQSRAKVFEDDFRMTVRANANALPYKGLELVSAKQASVNSVPSQIRELFDFDDPSWLRIEGLIEGTPVIEQMTFRVVESAMFVPGGRSPVPAGTGDSPGWKLPPWQLESVLLAGGRKAFAAHDVSLAYKRPGHEEPLFSVTVNDGWQEIFVQGGIGSPPAPSYLWDILLEVAEVRLHDGGIAEGEALVEFTLSNVPVGIDTGTLNQQIRKNFEADPASLVDVATQLIDTSEGAADVYYFRASPTRPANEQGDWLFFVNESDIRKDDAGKPVRPYAYSHPGFYEDDALTKKVSDRRSLEGDVEHEKVRAAPGLSVYAEGEKGTVMKLTVGPKPSENRMALEVTRVR